MDFDFERPPLVDHLRQILEKYPDGGQILKVCSFTISLGYDSVLGATSECRGCGSHRGSLPAGPGTGSLCQEETHGPRPRQKRPQSPAGKTTVSVLLLPFPKHILPVNLQSQRNCRLQYKVTEQV